MREVGKAETIGTVKKPTTMLSGIVMVAGCAVGAGMFSLPTVSSGMWFGWSVVCMLFSWFCMYHVSLMILEVNLNFQEGESFDTLVTATLGKGWNIANGLLFAFVLYILEYAYISGGSSIINNTLAPSLGFELPQMVAGVVFSLVLAFVVWASTKAVSRFVTLLFAGMIIAFLMTFLELTPAIELGRLLKGDSTDVLSNNSAPYWYFLFAALPFYLTSFGFHSLMPSLVKYYGKNPQLIGRSVLIGSLACFVIYLFWIIGTMGSLERNEFLSIVAGGGNVGVLVTAIKQVVPTDNLSDLLNLFTNMAIISSFLGVSLGLFDFIADKLKFEDTAIGRLKTALVTFVPPTIGGVFFPDGFIYAIGFAGLALAFNALVIPPLMLRSSRKIFTAPDSTYRVWGGNRLIYFIISMGLFYACCHILMMLDFLPVFGR